MGDNEHYLAFYEAATHASHAALARMFAAILAYCDPRKMWDAFSPHLAEGESEDSICDALIHLEADRICAGVSLTSFPTIPQIDQAAVDRKKRDARLEFEPDAERVYASEHTPMLNEEHRHAFEAIVADVVGGVQSTHFVDGAGGSGGTFPYNVLIAEIR